MTAETNVTLTPMTTTEDMLGSRIWTYYQDGVVAQVLIEQWDQHRVVLRSAPSLSEAQESSPDQYPLSNDAGVSHDVQRALARQTVKRKTQS